MHAYAEFFIGVHSRSFQAVRRLVIGDFPFPVDQAVRSSPRDLDIDSSFLRQVADRLSRENGLNISSGYSFLPAS